VGGSACADSEVNNGQFHQVGFDGMQWQLLNPYPTRAILGPGAGDSPQFTGMELGHASDTTITRVSAGVIAVEGSNVLLPSGLGSITQAYDAELAAIAGLTPSDAQYIVGAANGMRSAERVATDTTTIDGGMGTAAQAKWHVIDVSITFSKLQNIATDRLGGGDTASSDDPEEISVGAAWNLRAQVAFSAP
jgi:hypothetical protein